MSVNKKNLAIVLFSTLIVVIIFWFSANSFLENKKQEYYSQILEVKNGFGYTIKSSKTDKIVIKQEFIPSLNQYKVFCSKKDAMKIGNLVAKKLNAHLTPAITQTEIQEYSISLNCE